MVSTLAVKRRTIAERRALALLRGADTKTGPTGTTRQSWLRTLGTLTSAQAQPFAELRHVAGRVGFTICPPSAPYVGADELMLLSWIAGAQRVLGPDRMPDVALLRDAVTNCSNALEAIGLRLSPLTVYGVRLQERWSALAPGHARQTEGRARHAAR